MLFRQLEYFVAVARERHFARAAETCFVSQPALSAAISKLETELGVSLINRGHTFEGLTPEGERLVIWARRILAEHDAFTSEVRAVQTGISGTLRIGIGPTAAAATALIVEEFASAHPLARIQLSEHLRSVDLHRHVIDFELDAAIAYLPPEDQKGVNTSLLYRERYVAISTPNLIPAETLELTWVEAAQLPLVLLNSHMRVREFIDHAFAANDLHVTPHVEAESVETLSALVQTGGWVSIVPHTLTHTFAAANGIRAIPLVDPTIHAEVVLATHPSASLITRALVDTAEKCDLSSLTGSREVINKYDR